MKKKIAVTGGIGSGKSSVLEFLAERGFPTFSCDEIYKEIILTPTYIQKISKIFPRCIEDGKINRKILSQIVFNNPENLARLNAISHPLIMETLFDKMNACNQESVFAEVPLLFEGNYEGLFDGVLVVLREKEQRIQAIMNRDAINREEALRKIAMQFDYDNPQNRFEDCNAILIYNDENLEELKSKVFALNF